MGGGFCAIIKRNSNITLYRLVSNYQINAQFPHSITIHMLQWGVRWLTGLGTTLQTGRSRVRFPMVSLEFFSDIILTVALWPWG